jgi:biofilm PGA synthesis N-glycosyltransferase PgaC
LPPEISIGICAYNEGKNIGKLLNNILEEQNLKEPFEILVVASGCTDNTIDIVQNYHKKYPEIHLFVEKERKGKASAINRILSDAKGKVTIFVSADTLPDKISWEKSFIYSGDSTASYSRN